MVGGGGLALVGLQDIWYMYFTVYTVLGSGGGGGGLVGNNTLQLKFSSICFYCIISSKPWGGGGGSYFAKGYTIYSAIHSYFAWRIFPVSVYIVLFLQSHAVGKGWGGGQICLFSSSLHFGVCGGGGGGGGGMRVSKTMWGHSALKSLSTKFCR